MPSQPRSTRRDFLRATAAGAAGLALPAVGAGSTGTLRAPLAKSCIFINLVGGPSHLDTFDPKPEAPSEVRGPFRPIPTNVPGIQLSELFPKLAAKADRFSLMRSMPHDAPPIHEAGFQLLNTGRLFRDGPEWPSAGVVVSYLNSAGSGRGYVLMPDSRVDTGIDIPLGQSWGFLQTAASHCSVMWREVGNGIHSFENYREHIDYDLGRLCKDAVSEVERGAKFATLNTFPTVFDSPSWDCHADRGSLRTDLNDYRETVAPEFDTAFAALLTDLEDRGLLESTLVVATGEFGRTPKLNSNGGRDHWAGCWTALVAGGGVKGGRVIGASDKIGSEPQDRPLTPQELVATIFHTLGVAPDATIPGPDGVPVAVYPSRPVLELF
jgi:hypothetical protein